MKAETFSHPGQFGTRNCEITITVHFYRTYAYLILYITSMLAYMGSFYFYKRQLQISLQLPPLWELYSEVPRQADTLRGNPDLCSYCKRMLSRHLSRHLLAEVACLHWGNTQMTWTELRLRNTRGWRYHFTCYMLMNQMWWLTVSFHLLHVNESDGTIYISFTSWCLSLSHLLEQTKWNPR